MATFLTCVIVCGALLLIVEAIVGLVRFVKRKMNPKAESEEDDVK